jgi:hypothetical protein
MDMVFRPGTSRIATTPQLTRKSMARLSKAERAFLAVDMVSTSPVKLTLREAAERVGVSLSYLMLAKRVIRDKPDLREFCEFGVLPLSAVAKQPRPVSDFDIDLCIARAGVERVWERLDLLTAPTTMQAAG